MNERLLKRWAITEKLLSEAALQVKDSAGFVECMDYIGYNEFGLALDTLAADAAHQNVDTHFWHLLKKAAEVMGRSEQVKEFRAKRYLARKSAAQQAVQSDGPASGGSAR
ncbi:hypothetical protein [Solimonas marina]|uniref:Uncharacterized protein n=1 Tax=Solimonas marina TaxID=2714601 RepID=A0A970BBJ3_9GAMM|nr:hypothetical protein [Solimonas marina]NKF24501.1 hypothetical protein [Solimonas marina]